jgi:hypothetical protein
MSKFILPILAVLCVGCANEAPKARVYYTERWFNIHHADWRQEMKADSITFNTIK